MKQYIELSKAEWVNEGATQGTATLVARIRAQKDGRTVDDGGQGAETPLDKDDPTLEALQGDGLPIETGEYNTSPGGDVVMISDEELKGHGGSIITSQSEIDCVRNQTAFYVHNAYRVPATPENTFLLQALGRTAVDFAYREAVHVATDRVLEGRTPFYGKHRLGISREHWGTLTALAQQSHLTSHYYENRNINPDDAIITMLDELEAKEQLHQMPAILLNYPLNPTSQTISLQQMSRVVHKVSEVNSRHNLSMQLIIDVPYAFACAVHNDMRGTYLNTGLQHTLDDVDNVPWTFIASTSKLLSMAKTGHTIMVVDKKRARDIGGKLCRTGVGLARVNQLSKNIANLLGGDKQDILWDRKAQVREKYTTDDQYLVDAFGDRLVPGSNEGMLRLSEIPVAEVFNRNVYCSTDGKHRILRDGFDVTTYLANEFGSAVVPNEIRGDQLCLRIAKREAPEVFRRLVANLKDGLEEIRNSDQAVSPALAV